RDGRRPDPRPRAALRPPAATPQDRQAKNSERPQSMTAPGFFELYSEARPALPAGAYTASSTQTLIAATPHDGDQQIPVDDTAFPRHMAAPRAAMRPDQPLSPSPPAGPQGDWRERLPQIVLKRRTLPWERNPTPQVSPDDAPPWLALVVLAEGEGQLSSDVDP